MELCGKEIRFYGGLVRIPYIDGEGCRFLTDPKWCGQCCKNAVYFFTFTHELSDIASECSSEAEMAGKQRQSFRGRQSGR